MYGSRGAIGGLKRREVARTDEGLELWIWQLQLLLEPATSGEAFSHRDREGVMIMQDLDSLLTRSTETRTMYRQVYHWNLLRCQSGIKGLNVIG